AGTRPDEAFFRGKSMWYLYVPFLLGAVIAGWLALELGLNERLRAMLGVRTGTAREIAWALGGLALLVFPGAAWEWDGGVRWVAVSPDGLRWFRKGRVHTREWGEFAGVQRVATKFYLDGQHTGTAHGAEVRFRTGPPLVISPLNILDYEGLIAALEAGPQRPS